MKNTIYILLALCMSGCLQSRGYFADSENLVTPSEISQDRYLVSNSFRGRLNAGAQFDVADGTGDLGYEVPVSMVRIYGEQSNQAQMMFFNFMGDLPTRDGTIDFTLDDMYAPVIAGGCLGRVKDEWDFDQQADRGTITVAPDFSGDTQYQFTLEWDREDGGEPAIVEGSFTIGQHI